MLGNQGRTLKWSLKSKIGMLYHQADSSIRSSHIWGDPFITFAPRGGRGVEKLPKFANDSTDRLREMRTKGREGV